MHRILARAALAGVAAAAALTMAAGTAGAATTTPSWHHAGPEYFTIYENGTTAQNGIVNAYGPVRGRGGTLGGNSAGTVAWLQFARGTVYVAHPVTPDPVVNWRACTASVTQYGQWKILGGSLAYHGIRGAGRFALTEFLKFGWKHHRCQAGNPKANPVYFQLDVRAQGWASAPGRVKLPA